MGGVLIFLKTLRAFLLNDDLSNEPNVGRIHLAGQYLLTNLLTCIYCTMVIQKGKKKISGTCSGFFVSPTIKNQLHVLAGGDELADGAEGDQFCLDGGTKIS